MTFILLVALLLMGHAYMIILVMLCQTVVYREITALFSLKTAGTASDDPELKGRDPWSKTLNWYFFAVTNYFLYGESIIYYFKVMWVSCPLFRLALIFWVQHIVFVDAHLTTLANKHRFLSFMLYMIGFMGFVGSLQRRYLKQQFGLFCWVHMTLLMIVMSRCALFPLFGPKYPLTCLTIATSSSTTSLKGLSGSGFLPRLSSVTISSPTSAASRLVAPLSSSFHPRRPSRASWAHSLALLCSPSCGAHISLDLTI
jgi:CDP-diglyceride synthetase